MPETEETIGIGVFILITGGISNEGALPTAMLLIHSSQKKHEL